MASFPAVNAAWMNPDLAQKWERILAVRAEVTKALEEARAKKLIGHSLDAAVTIYADQQLYDALYPYTDELRTVFIVSKAVLVQGDKPAGAFESAEINGLSILIESSDAVKCERCWIHDSSVGTSSKHPTICNRCDDALKQII